MLKPLIFAIAAVMFLTGTASAAPYKWTPAKAATVVKARYTTVDPKAYAAIDEQIKAELAGGRSPDDPVVVALKADLRQTLHAATVTSARCVGVSAVKGAGFARFHCTAQLVGKERTPPDHLVYTATKKLTVFVKSARIVSGTR